MANKAFLDIENSLGGNLWVARSCDERISEAVSQRYNMPEILSRILVSRKVSMDEVDDFIEPKLNRLLPNPSSLKDMDKATDYVANLIMQKAKIGILGDYDVDGATSSALLKIFFDALRIEAKVYIPDRDEGYGPSNQAFDYFMGEKITNVIAVDCGTTAFEPLQYAFDNGIKTIVIDHHEAETKLPKAFAVINPKRVDEEPNNPSRIMAAVGVSFMFAVGVNRSLREKGFYKNGAKEPDLMGLLDLVALGTVCDVVPLLGVNRAYVKNGLKVMAKRGNFGITALQDKCKIDSAPNAFHLGFMLGPRINACGRVGQANFGYRILSSQSYEEAMKIAEMLDAFNEERKDVEAAVLYDAIEMVESSAEHDMPLVFAYGDNWHHGVIGIVAGRLKERYRLPAFVMGVEGDEVKGSARSITGVDIGVAVMAAKERGILTKGGGHIMAAGFSLHKSRLAEFKAFLSEHIKKQLGDKEITPMIEIDGAIDIRGATPELVERLETLAPFGASNPEPKIVITNVKVGKSDIVGSGHVRCYLSGSAGGRIKAMAFRAADSDIGNMLLKNNGESLHIAGTLQKDNWMGKNDVQMIISDVALVK